MTDEFDGLLWAYRAVFTQADAGGGTIAVNIVATERTLILYGMVGIDDYAADRTIAAQIIDVDGAVIGTLLFPTALDNERVPLMVDNVAAVVNNAGLQLEKRVLYGRTDMIRITATALVQNETLTIAIRALIEQAPPTVTTTGSGGTVTIATTYDKVI